MLHAAGNGVDFAADTPVEFLYLCTRIQVDDAMAEKVECLFAYLLRIVPRFQHTALAQIIPDVIQFLHQFVSILSRFPVVVHFGQGSRFQHFEDKHGVMGSQAASRFGNDIGMREPVFVGNIDESRHHIVDIFLDGIVDGAFAT